MFKEETKNNDFYLMYWIWKEEFDNLNLANNIVLDFDKVNIVNVLSLLKDRKLSHPSGIMRARRKMQEKYPDLRGQLWEARHREQEVVKDDLGYTKPKVAQ